MSWNNSSQNNKASLWSNLNLHLPQRLKIMAGVIQRMRAVMLHHTHRTKKIINWPFNTKSLLATTSKGLTKTSKKSKAWAVLTLYLTYPNWRITNPPMKSWIHKSKLLEKRKNSTLLKKGELKVTQIVMMIWCCQKLKQKSDKSTHLLAC
jgi:hypothetical protein